MPVGILGSLLGNLRHPGLVLVLTVPDHDDDTPTRVAVDEPPAVRPAESPASDRDQVTNLLSTVTLGAVALEDPGISPDADGSKVSVNELEPVIPPQATICPVIDGELA